jgi:hypothetical protein
MWQRSPSAISLSAGWFPRHRTCTGRQLSNPIDCQNENLLVLAIRHRWQAARTPLCGEARAADFTTLDTSRGAHGISPASDALNITSDLRKQRGDRAINSCTKDGARGPLPRPDMRIGRRSADLGGPFRACISAPRLYRPHKVCEAPTLTSRTTRRQHPMPYVMSGSPRGAP